jgi:hypothetical protein
MKKAPGMPTQVRAYCLAAERVDAPLNAPNGYGRMFDLPALNADEALLHRIGAAGGLCDGGHSNEESTVEAGWPFFSQYVAHDLTADRSPLRARADLAALRNVARWISPTRAGATGSRVSADH